MEDHSRDADPHLSLEEPRDAQLCADDQHGFYDHRITADREHDDGSDSQKKFLRACEPPPKFGWLFMLGCFFPLH